MRMCVYVWGRRICVWVHAPVSLYIYIASSSHWLANRYIYRNTQRHACVSQCVHACVRACVRAIERGSVPIVYLFRQFHSAWLAKRYIDTNIRKEKPIDREMDRGLNPAGTVHGATVYPEGTRIQEVHLLLEQEVVGIVSVVIHPGSVRIWCRCRDLIPRAGLNIRVAQKCGFALSQ